MTQDDLANGRLVCLIGVASAKPAEFVIFRIGQWTASANCVRSDRMATPRPSPYHAFNFLVYVR